MDIALATAVIAGLFLVIGLAEPLAARARLPYSVILAGIGVLIGIGASFLLRTEITDALNPVAETILGLPIRSNVFLYVFLPTLLFQVTLGLNLRRMMDDLVPILVLAVVAVVAATLSVGYALFWTGTMPLMACLLVGAIVSTTDPSAVVSIFRSIAAPQRLARIVEGESLLERCRRDRALRPVHGLRDARRPGPDARLGLGAVPVSAGGRGPGGVRCKPAGGLAHGPFLAVSAGAVVDLGGAALSRLYRVRADGRRVRRDRDGDGGADAEPCRAGAADARCLGQPARGLGPPRALGRCADLRSRGAARCRAF